MIPVDTTKRLVLALFHGRLDKSGKPVGAHSIRVFENTVKLFGRATAYDLNVGHAALLHDVMEDTILSLVDLHSFGYESRTLEIVSALTNDTGEPYESYVRRICKAADPMVIAIKLADNLDNGSIERISNLPSEAQRQWARDRYMPARTLLLDALAARGFYARGGSYYDG
jgi:(p)ppGpp synthase/HD superfamily hydrolase